MGMITVFREWSWILGVGVVVISWILGLVSCGVYFYCFWVIVLFNKYFIDNLIKVN